MCHDILYHRKRISQYSAQHELDALAVADCIDPDDQWHIGHVEVESKVQSYSKNCFEPASASSDRRIWTLKFKYGGKSLNHLHKESPDMIATVLKGLGNIMDGLVEFHHHHLYHRDVKVNNIVYSVDGLVRLIDFGTAIMDLPDTPTDPIYNNIYVVWPFETQLVNGCNSCIFTDPIYGEYVDDPYYKPVCKFHGLDPSELRANAINIKRKLPDKVVLHQEITKRIDVYSFGIMLSHLLCNKSISGVLTDRQYSELKLLSRKMVEPYTLERISMEQAARTFRGIWAHCTDV